MRMPAFGIIQGLSRIFQSDTSLEMFRRMCFTRYFEEGVVESVKRGSIKCIVYLSSGQEAIAAAMSLVISDFMIFAQHRCHATYLSFGGNPIKLRMNYWACLGVLAAGGLDQTAFSIMRRMLLCMDIMA